jgi:large subunit ribosomal protein L24e
MPTCSFCKERYKEPRGLTVFTFDGRSIHYCSSKCRKNMEHLKRDPKKTNWVKKQTGFMEETENLELVEKKTEDSKVLEENKEKPSKK